MQLSNNDFSFKKESDNEKNINVNLLNRKFNLIKLKNVYQEQINQMKIKVEQVKNSIKEFQSNNKNSNKNVKKKKKKKKIEDVQNHNTELGLKTKEIEEENEQIEKFFHDHFQKNNNQSIND